MGGGGGNGREERREERREARKLLVRGMIIMSPLAVEGSTAALSSNCPLDFSPKEELREV